jgi:hypothetical protein
LFEAKILFILVSIILFFLFCFIYILPWKNIEV